MRTIVTMDTTTTPTKEQPVLVRGQLPMAAVSALGKLIYTFFRTTTKLQVNHAERIPTGPFIGCPNHTSYTDTFLLAAFASHVNRSQDMVLFAADTYRRFPPMSWGWVPVDTIWVHRGAIGPSTIKVALQMLKAGRVLGVAPEGTRSKSGTLQTAKTGAVSLALTANVPVVPMGIIGAQQALPSFFRGRRQPLILNIGQPIHFEPPTRQERAAKLDAYTTELMCQIAAMLPSDYHGVYADHPRLKELLTASAAA